MNSFINNIAYLALGDSYTIGHGVNRSECFPELLSEELNKRGINVSEPEMIAKTGWTTEDLGRRINDANITYDSYDLVSLLIGVNNYYDGGSIEVYDSQFRNLLLKCIEFAKGNEKGVIVISIPDYGYTPFGQGNQAQISSGIDKFNEVNKKISTSLGVKYFDIVSISRQGLADPTLIAEDGLHPSGKMYKLWVDYMLKGVIKMINQI